MKKILLILSFVLLLGSSEVLARQCKDIRIPRGQYTTSIKGVTSKKYACYRVRARAGQKITLQLISADKGVKFSLAEDYFDAGFTAEDVRFWQGETGNVDAYLVSIGDGKPGSAYTFKVTIR